MSSYGRWGRISVASGSDPISGSEASYVPPSNRIFKIKSVHSTMYANSGSSGTARSPYIEITGSGGLSLYKVYSGHDYISGSGTVDYYWLSGLGDSTLHTGSSIVVTGFPTDVVIDGKCSVKTATTNFDDEDNWTGLVLFVEEFLTDSV